MYIRELTIDEFKNFANTYDLYSVYQTPEYGFTMEGQGFNPLIVGLMDKNENILGAAVLFVEKRFAFKYAYAPGGFLIDYYNFDLLKIFTLKLKKFLSRLDIVAVKLNPLVIKDIYDPKKKSFIPNLNYETAYSNLRRLGYYHYGYNYYFEALKPRYEAVIDIDKPYYILFNEIKKEFRTKIRSAEENGIRIYKGRPSELDYLYEHTKRKYPRDLNYFRDLYFAFEKNSMIDYYYAKLDTAIYLEKIQKKYEEAEQENHLINNLILTNSNKNVHKLINRKINNDNLFANYKNKLVLATNLLKNHPDGIILATIIVVTYRDTVYVLMDAQDPKYRMLSAKHLLIWKLIHNYSKMGYKKFNLGGVTNPELDQSQYKGLNQFKTNFGAKIYEYAGDFELITNNTKYFMYRNTLSLQNLLKKTE